MTETTFPTAGGPEVPGPASEKRRRLVVAGVLLALAVALLGAYLLRGGQDNTSTAGPVPHVVRSPTAAVPTTPARSPAAKPSPSTLVVRNPFLPLVVPAPAGTAPDASSGSGAPVTGTGTGADIAGSPSPGATTSGSTGTGSTGADATGGTGSDSGAAPPAAPVDGSPNFTG